MTQPATVAVTGAGGFLGSQVCRALTKRGYRVIGMVRAGSRNGLPADLAGRVESRAGDMLDRDSLAAAVRGADAVVHCAAVVSIDTADGEQIRAVNLAGVRNLIQTCINQGIPRLTHVSSVHAYAGLRGTELNPASPLAVDSPVPYCAAKAEAQLAVMQAMERGLLRGCVVCPSGIVGPGDHRPSIVGRLVMDMARRQLPLLIDEGYWWCDVRDVADAIAASVSAPDDGAIYFTPGNYAKFGCMTGICSEALGYDVTRPVVPYWLAFAGLPFVRAYAAARRMSPLYSRTSLHLARNCPDGVDDASARGVLGYAPRSLRDSIRDTLAWFRENGTLN